MRRTDFILFLALIACAILVVNTQHRARRLFIDLERERGNGEQLAADLRRLQADQASLSAANRVERVAAGLHMRAPDPARSVAITALPAVADAQSPSNAATVQLARQGAR